MAGQNQRCSHSGKTILSSNTKISMSIKELYNDIDKRPNILAVIHDFRYTKGGSTGGTTLHLMDIIEGLKERYNFHILYWSADTHKHHITSFFGQNVVTKILGDFSLNRREPWKRLYCNNFSVAVANAIEALKIDLIHVHHLKNMFLDIFEVAQKSNIPITYTIHDFYAACPSINLMRWDNVSCHNPNCRECKTCAEKKFGIAINKWQKEFGTALSSVNSVIAPAESTKEIFNSVYPSLNISVIEHGYDIEPCIQREKKRGDMFNIAFVGSITRIKGLDLFLDFVKITKGSNIRVHLFGTTHKVAVKSDGVNFINHGSYKREELPRLLISNNIDVVCLPSICAETFSYTLSESLLCRVPVIGLNIGAIAQRIKAIDAGWVLPVETDAKELFKAVKLLSKENYSEYLEKIENIDKNYNSLPTVVSMCEKYNSLYSSLIKDERVYSNNSSFYENADDFVMGIEIDKSGREEYRTLRDRITSENLSFKEIISEIKIFRKRYPQSKLRNKIAFKLLWHKFSHKNIQ